MAVNVDLENRTNGVRCNGKRTPSPPTATRYLPDRRTRQFLLAHFGRVQHYARIEGAQTDKARGLAELRLTAEKGHYLKPFAELLLAVAALRDKNEREAKRLLSDLMTQFPGNQLYRDEFKKVSKS